MLPKSVTKVDALIQSFNLSQRSRYSTHMHREILNLVFETSNSDTVSSLPSPIGDNFEFFLEIWCIIFIQKLPVKYLAFNPHYITHKYSSRANILMKGIMFCENNQQSHMIYRFLSKAKKKKKKSISGLWFHSYCEWHKVISKIKVASKENIKWRNLTQRGHFPNVCVLLKKKKQHFSYIFRVMESKKGTHLFSPLTMVTLVRSICEQKRS